MSTKEEKLAELLRAGYQEKGSRMCKGETCSAELAWFVNPGGRWVFYDADTLDRHRCKDQAQFRRADG